MHRVPMRRDPSENQSILNLKLSVFITIYHTCKANVRYRVVDVANSEQKHFLYRRNLFVMTNEPFFSYKVGHITYSVVFGIKESCQTEFSVMLSITS